MQIFVAAEAHVSLFCTAALTSRDCIWPCTVLLGLGVVSVHTCMDPKSVE